MNGRREPFVERILARTARAMGGGGLHPLQVLTSVEEACRAAARGGNFPNHITVSFSPPDLVRYRPALSDLEAGMRDLVAELGGAPESTIILFERSPAVDQGAVAVAARYADVKHRPATVPPGATQRITRHRGWWVSFSDGTRVRLSHTPFAIGRAIGNDLVVANMAVSRHHARIRYAPEGFILEDLGSRNGLLVSGNRLDRVVMSEHVPVRIGDIDLWLERGE
jgi:hypothetical protein